MSKRIMSSAEAMQGRLRLAALDNNHHVDRQQATTRNRELNLQFSKPAGTDITKPIKVAKTYDFHTELLFHTMAYIIFYFSLIYRYVCVSVFLNIFFLLLLLSLKRYYSDPFLCCLRQTNMSDEVKEQLLAVQQEHLNRSK